MKTQILMSPLVTRAPKPALVTAAPTNPPTRACELDVGNPHHQVIRSQIIAPISPEKMTATSITAGSTVPFPIVEATLRLNTNRAAKLKKAAHITAKRGERTRVETIVATELAASWKPLMKSKARATTTTIPKIQS